VPAWDLPLSLDRLLAGLEVIEQRRVVEGQLENKPPVIIYVDRPAILVILDGEPILKPIENSALMAVVNTPFPMVFNKADKSYYLMSNDTWYRAAAVTDKWEEIADPPQAVMQVQPETQDTENPSEIDSDLRIIGATEPTELIATNGPPRLTPFPGNDLMFVEKTTSDILYEVDTGRPIIGHRTTDRPLSVHRETVRPSPRTPSQGRRGIVLPVGADRPAAAPCSFPVTATCTTSSPAARVGT